MAAWHNTLHPPKCRSEKGFFSTSAPNRCRLTASQWRDSLSFHVSTSLAQVRLAAAVSSRRFAFPQHPSSTAFYESPSRQEMIFSCAAAAPGRGFSFRAPVFASHSVFASLFGTGPPGPCTQAVPVDRPTGGRSDRLLTFANSPPLRNDGVPADSFSQSLGCTPH